jgi:hypothetical protein
MEKRRNPPTVPEHFSDKQQTFFDGLWIANATKVANEFYVGRSAFPGASFVSRPRGSRRIAIN